MFLAFRVRKPLSKPLLSCPDSMAPSQRKLVPYKKTNKLWHHTVGSPANAYWSQSPTHLRTYSRQQLVVLRTLSVKVQYKTQEVTRCRRIGAEDRLASVRPAHQVKLPGLVCTFVTSEKILQHSYSQEVGPPEHSNQLEHSKIHKKLDHPSIQTSNTQRFTSSWTTRAFKPVGTPKDSQEVGPPEHSNQLEHPKIHKKLEYHEAFANTRTKTQNFTAVKEVLCNKNQLILKQSDDGPKQFDLVYQTAS